MSQTFQQKRLRALGYDPDDLPHRENCRYCNNTEPGDISYDIFSGYWTVWCGCGCSSISHSDLIESLNYWNNLQLSVNQSSGH